VTRVLLDANVFIHALGRDASLRPACQRVIDHLDVGSLAGDASSMMVQEVLHVRHRRTGDRSRAAIDARNAASLVRLHPVDARDVEAALAAFMAHPRLEAADAVHLAVARRHGLTTIVTTDTGFDGADGLRRVDPTDRATVEALAGAPPGGPKSA
jgi:predicted nucleic acid-binding protein